MQKEITWTAQRVFNLPEEDIWKHVSSNKEKTKSFYYPNIRFLLKSNLSTLKNSFSLLGLKFESEWEEYPIEWIKPYKFKVIKNYMKGPFSEVHLTLNIDKLSYTKSRLNYEVKIKSKNIVGNILAFYQYKVGLNISLLKMIKELDKHIFDRFTYNKTKIEKVKLAPGAKTRLKVFEEKLISMKIREDLVKLFIKIIRNADEMTLFRIRPYVLADYYNIPRKEMLELCLHAVRIGLLNFRWELLCLSEEDNVTNLDSNISKMVEITFSINPLVRNIIYMERKFRNTTVVSEKVSNFLVMPFEKQINEVFLPNGRYRIRSNENKSVIFIKVSELGKHILSLDTKKFNEEKEDINVNNNFKIHLKNTTNIEDFITIEKIADGNQAVTAAEISEMKLFQDLFSNEALKSGQQVSVESLTVLFTDLRNSTKMYREIGDAVAVGKVMDHFMIIKNVIEEYDGVIIKTIGDSVMAVFKRPVYALKAVLKIQELSSDSEDSLQMKAGIHFGPCVSVKMENGRDYFGTTVNLAARLQNLSLGNDIIISPPVFSDPEVLKMLSRNSDKISFYHFKSYIKGFDENEFDLWRLASTQIEENTNMEYQVPIFPIV